VPSHIVNSRLERGTLLPLVCSSSRCDSVLVRILWLSILALPGSFPREVICEALPARRRCLHILYVTCIGEVFRCQIAGMCPCYKSGTYICVLSSRVAARGRQHDFDWGSNAHVPRCIYSVFYTTLVRKNEGNFLQLILCAPHTRFGRARVRASQHAPASEARIARTPAIYHASSNSSSPSIFAASRVCWGQRGRARTTFGGPVGRVQHQDLPYFVIFVVQFHHVVLVGHLGDGRPTHHTKYSE